jgi:cytochrome P450
LTGEDLMDATTSDKVYYDNADMEIGRDPHPVFKRLRDEAPLYYNEDRDFFALSRYDDVAAALVNHATYLSGKGVTLDLIRSGMEIPPGTVLFEDPPAHDIHRALLSRMFTPKKVAALEPQVRQFCADILEPFVGAGGFDFVADVGLEVPMRVIGMLLGIPRDQQETIREQFVGSPATPKQESETDYAEGLFSVDVLNDYVDWRAEHPSDDVVTELLNVEFEDEHGERRRLAKEELLMYVNVLAVAGNETTGRLISFTGQLLAEHPAQRRQVAADLSLLPNAIEEVMRFEPPALQTCRYVAREVEHYGQTVPAGSAMLLLLASANRDERRYDDPDRFDIHRKANHFSFGFGPHYCLGANLARLETRIVFEEVISRWPEWDIDTDRARFEVSPTLRSWETLPVRTR